MKKTIILVIILSVLIGVVISYWDKFSLKGNSSNMTPIQSLYGNFQQSPSPSPTPSPIPIDSNTNLKETVEKNSPSDFSGDFDNLKSTIKNF